MMMKPNVKLVLDENGCLNCEKHNNPKTFTLSEIIQSIVIKIQGESTKRNSRRSHRSSVWKKVLPNQSFRPDYLFTLIRSIQDGSEYRYDNPVNVFEWQRLLFMSKMIEIS